MTTTITTCEEMKVRVRRIQPEISLKMTNRTHTDKTKMVQLYYLVPGFPGCVISMFKLIFINRSALVWSGEWAPEKSHYTLAFKAQWCDHSWFFRRTAKNLVAYATSWSLTLSPDADNIYWIELPADDLDSFINMIETAKDCKRKPLGDWTKDMWASSNSTRNCFA